MNRADVEHFIQKELNLSNEKKLLLNCLVAKNPNNLLSLFVWLKSLNLFISDSFQELPVSQKREIIQNLIRAAEKRRTNQTFMDLIGIFFGKTNELPSASKTFPLPFLESILKRSRQESCVEISAFLIELLLVCCDRPVEGSSVEDYLPGLQHKDDLIRCKVLNFLYQFFKEEALIKILGELLRAHSSPSILFCVTLSHFLRLHPNNPWTEFLTKGDLDLRNWDKKDARWLFFHEFTGSMSRHQFLSLIYTQDYCRKMAEQLDLIPHHKIPAIRWDRLEAIKADMQRR